MMVHGSLRMASIRVGLSGAATFRREDVVVGDSKVAAGGSGEKARRLEMLVVDR
jgi:hypothetical protein